MWSFTQNDEAKMKTKPWKITVLPFWWSKKYMKKNDGKDDSWNPGVYQMHGKSRSFLFTRFLECLLILQHNIAIYWNKLKQLNPVSHCRDFTIHPNPTNAFSRTSKCPSCCSACCTFLGRADHWRLDCWILDAFGIKNIMWWWVKTPLVNIIK